MQYHQADDIEQVKYQATLSLVIRQILINEAQQKKILNKDDINNIEKVEKAIDKLLKNELTVPIADKKSCQKYYENNKERFKDKNNKFLAFDLVIDKIKHYLYVQSFQNAIVEYIKNVI